MFAFGLVTIAAVSIVAVIVVLAGAAMAVGRRNAAARRELAALQRVARNPLYREHLEDVQARNVRVVRLLELAYRDFSDAMREVSNATTER